MLDILISTGIFSAMLGMVAWFLKRHIDKVEEKRELKERNTETLMLYIMQNGRAACVLAEATARAVQRIPDAHCNGDMTEALAEAEKIQKEEKDFLLSQGVKHIFGD